MSGGKVAMRIDARRSLPAPVGWCLTAEPSAPAVGNHRLQINVIFTTAKDTVAALKAAQILAQDLDAQTLLMVPLVVPRQFSISSPPVSIAFAQQRAYAMAMDCRKENDIHVQVYLCANRRECMLKVLKPNSLIIIGGKKRWWPLPEQKLAKALRANGHNLMFVNGG
jgi:hypothetical protein